jgi:hypothetical protein
MAAAGGADGGELKDMYERKLRAMGVCAVATRVLDKRLDTRWHKFMEVCLAHRDKVASDMSVLISSYDHEAPR